MRNLKSYTPLASAEYETKIEVLMQQRDEANSENTRLRLRVEQLRGLCKSAVGMLKDDYPMMAEEIYEQIGDMEI